MATYATLTVPVQDIIGADFNASRASVWIEPNVPFVLADSIRVGGRREQVVNGVATFANLVTTDTADNPASFGYRVTITAPPKGAAARKDIVNLTTADFPFTATADLTDISEAWDNVVLPVEWRSAFRNEMEALRDETEALIVSDLGTTDGQTRALIELESSQTAQALNATYGTRSYTLAPETPAPKTPVGNILSRFQSGDTWTDAAGGWTTKTDIVAHGAQSWGFDSSATVGENHVTRLELPEPLDVRGKSVLARVWVSDPTKITLLQGSFDSGLSGTSNTMNYANTTIRSVDGGHWQDIVFAYGSTTDQTGTPDRAAMRRFGLRVVTSGVIQFRVNSVSLIDNAEAVPAFPNGVIILESDDGGGTNTLMHKVLSEYGIPGTINMISDNADQPGRLTLAQLRAWQDRDGWDIQGHAHTGTAHNTPFTGLTETQLDAELSAHKNWLRSNGFNGDFLAYPQGAHNETVRAVTARYFRGGRTVYTTPVTTAGVRPYAMAGWSVDNTTTTAQITGYMDLCVASGAPAHIIFHHWEDAGDITATDPKAWTTGRLRTIIEHGLAQGYSFATYSEVYGTQPIAQIQQVPDLDGVWRARDSNLLAWPCDPTSAASNYTLVSGTQYITRAKMDQAGVIAGVRFYVSTAGTSITEGSCDVYDSTGALLCTGSIATAVASTGFPNVTFTSPSRAMEVGETVYIGIRVTFTGTAPAVKGLSTASMPNMAVSGAASRYGTAGTGVTSPQASIAPSSITAASVGGHTLWAGLRA